MTARSSTCGWRPNACRPPRRPSATTSLLVARAENFIHGRHDIDDTIARLVAFEAAGADVLYAPFVTEPEHLRAIMSSTSRPFNALLRPDGPSVRELADLGVARISVGAAFTYAVYGALTDLATDLHDPGRHRFVDRAAGGRDLAARARQRLTAPGAT